MIAHESTIDDVMNTNEWAGLKVFLLIQVFKYNISETVNQIGFILGRMIVNGPICTLLILLMMS